MRRLLLSVLMISLLFLCACGGGEVSKQDFETWREEYASENHSVTAHVVFQGGDEHGDYTLCFTSADGTKTVEVIEPELIAGITATVGDGAASLSYDGIILETGEDAADRLSAMTALPWVDEAVRKGHLESVWTEESEEGESLFVSEIQMPDGLIITLWQNKNDMKPVFAAIRQGEAVELKIEILEYT